MNTRRRSLKAACLIVAASLTQADSSVVEHPQYKGSVGWFESLSAYHIFHTRRAVRFQN
jgi:hypothetical protein